VDGLASAISLVRLLYRRLALGSMLVSSLVKATTVRETGRVAAGTRTRILFEEVHMVDIGVDRAKLESMPDGARAFIAWNEGSGGDVFKVHDQFVVFEVPLYGGAPIYQLTTASIDEVLDLCYGWT
jgi:hypothetical protein